MAGRPEKWTAEYFPHYLSGDDMEYMVDSYESDGYVTWFRLMEKMCRSYKHFIRMNDLTKKRFAAKCRITEKKLGQIIQDLVVLEWLDRELWEKHKVLFSTKFAESLEVAYRRRRNDLPTRLDVLREVEGAINVDSNSINVDNNIWVNVYINAINGDINTINVPHKYMKELKEGRKEGKKSLLIDFVTNEKLHEAWAKWCDYRVQEKKEGYRTAAAKIAVIKKLFRDSGKDPRKAVRMIEDSIAVTAKNIIEVQTRERFNGEKPKYREL